jgi:hypothetical protein
MGRMRNTYKIFVRKSKGKRPLRSPRQRWEDNITVDLTETGWKGVDWLYLAQDIKQWWDLVNTVMYLQIP